MGLVVKRCPFFKKTAKKYLQKNKKLADAAVDFIEFKKDHPNEPYTGQLSNDKRSPPGTLYGKFFPKMKHANIAKDHKIWYTIDGNELRLYAILTHQDSGTAPSLPNRQKSIVQKFKNQVFEQNKKI